MTSIIKRPLAVTIAAWYMIGIYAYAMIESTFNILSPHSSTGLSIGGWIFVVARVGSLGFPIFLLNGMGVGRWALMITFLNFFCGDFVVAREKYEALGLVLSTILIYLPASNEFFRLADIRRAEKEVNKRIKITDKQA